MEHTDDRGDDDDGDTTGTFERGSVSTPGPSEQIPMQSRTTTMNRPPERGSKTAETSFIEGDVDVSRVRTAESKAWGALTDLFPNAKATDRDASYSKQESYKSKCPVMVKNDIPCSPKTAEPWN